MSAIQELRSLTAQEFDLPVVCPAGVRVAETPGGPACHCEVTKDVITASENPASLGKFCMGDYRACPVWQDAKERIWANREEVVDDIERPMRWSDMTGQSLRFEEIPVTDTVVYEV